MGDQRLRPVERLRCARAYRRVFEQGEKLTGSLFILYILPTLEPHSRLGLAVSKRVGNAAVRNHIKRCLRETFPAWRATAQLEFHVPGIASNSSYCCSAANASGGRRREHGVKLCTRIL